MFITLDFETYYDKEFSLSKITTEEYVRDDKFETIGVCVKVDADEPVWFSGSHAETAKFLSQYDWSDAAVLAHNTMFDGAILGWRFGIKPKIWLDTLSMARALHGYDAGNSLAKLAERYDIGKKGSEVLAAIGKHRTDFTAQELQAYGQYCVNDVELTYRLFNLMQQGFHIKELKLIDQTLRLFIEPTLELDLPMLEQHLEEVIERKTKLIEAANSNRDALMSNDKFAEALIKLCVTPPTKISPTTKKLTFAFAKSDDGMKLLQEHPDERVQALVAARLGAKSTLEETRTQRFIAIAKRGSLAVPLSYYAAHTGRWGGADKLNMQNLPRKSLLKSAIRAPKGYLIIDADSSQIEARTLAWLSGQNDLVTAFTNGEDVYKIMASAIYKKSVEKVTDAERFVGKTTILGAGYGMGHLKFRTQLRTFNVDLSETMCQLILTTYRSKFPLIPRLWEQANRCLDALASEKLKTTTFGNQPQAVNLLPGIGFDLPNNMVLRYNQLKADNTITHFDKQNYVYWTRNGLVRIYGGKVVENICQAVARCIIGEQMLKVAKKYKIVLTVHDAIACVVKEEERDEAMKYIDECMRWQPEWAATLPLACELGVGESYGDCSKKKSIAQWGLA